MSEWNEKKIDEELEAILTETEIAQEDELEQKIMQTINRRIRRVVYRTLTRVAIVLLVAILVINPLLNLIFFNPYQLNQEAKQKWFSLLRDRLGMSISFEEPEEKMLKVMRDYVRTTRPYRDVICLEVKKKGFARYEVEMQVANATEPIYFYDPNAWFDVNFGDYDNIKGETDVFTHRMGRFDGEYYQHEDTLRRIKELPESAKIYLVVSDMEVKTLNELKELPVKLDWLQVYQPNVEFQGGIKMMQSVLSEDEEYHMAMEEEALLDEYIETMEELIEYEEVWKPIGLSDGTYVYPENGVRFLRETCEDAKLLEGITSKNYAVYGQRDEVVQFLEENILTSADVEKVNLW